MKFPEVLLFALACWSVSPNALAQPPAQVDPASDGGSTSLRLLSAVGERVGHGVGVETSVLWPVYPGSHYLLRASIPVARDGRGQLLAGTQFHVPHTRSDEGRFSAVAAHLGYRTYLWKGLQGDAMANAGVGQLRDSVVDGEDYVSFDVDLQAVVGWRFDVGPVYVLVQPLGIGAVVYRSNPWEIVGEGRRTTEPPFYVGNVMLGLQL